MQVLRWTVVGMVVMAAMPGCTRTEEKPAATATAAVSPAAAAESRTMATGSAPSKGVWLSCGFWAFCVARRTLSWV